MNVETDSGIEPESLDEVDTESTLQPSDVVESDEVTVADDMKSRPPGPGLIEAFGWIILFFGLQLAATFILLIGAMLSTVGSVEELQGIELDIKGLPLR